MLGASDFTNAAKNRRTAAGGPGDSKDGAGARQAASGSAGPKNGIGGLQGLLTTDEAIPYCGKDVSSSFIISISYSHSATSVRRGSMCAMTKTRSPISSFMLRRSGFTQTKRLTLQARMWCLCTQIASNKQNLAGTFSKYQQSQLQPENLRQLRSPLRSASRSG